jgi:hypothetical protein
MTCPKCGSNEMTEITIDQDRQGNDIRAIVCANGDCDHVYREQSDTFDCLHSEVEIDEIARCWCITCGEYLGEVR